MKINNQEENQLITIGRYVLYVILFNLATTLGQLDFSGSINFRTSLLFLAGQAVLAAIIAIEKVLVYYVSQASKNEQSTPVSTAFDPATLLPALNSILPGYLDQITDRVAQKLNQKPASIQTPAFQDQTPTPVQVPAIPKRVVMNPVSNQAAIPVSGITIDTSKIQTAIAPQG